jgi:DNA-binding IclR family transcriptional regulator
LTTPDSNRQGVDAVEVAGAILQALVALPRPARLKDLEDHTGIASAKLHRYLVSMIRCGLVRRHAGGSRYDFGLLTYRMGQAAQHDHDLVTLLEPLMEEYAGQLTGPGMGHAIGLGQWVGHGATILRWFESDSPLMVRMKPGAMLDITGSATAKLLAAYLPRETTEPIVRKELAEKGQLTDKDVTRIYADYTAIRKRGIAHSLGARQSGLNALSAPVMDQHGAVVAAVTMLGMAPHFDASPDGRAAARLLKVSKELSARLGAAT